MLLQCARNAARNVARRSFAHESTRSMDTIYALSSAEGRAGVAVIRVSGDMADECLTKLTMQSKLPLPRVSV